MSPANEAWSRRRTAAANHRPKHIRLLLVAESPPADGYFYFEDAPADPLFGEVCTVLFEKAPDGEKTRYLKELRRRGVFVAELKPDAPRDTEPLAPYVGPLVLNVETLGPEKIVLIGAEVYDAAHAAMKKAGLPVVDARVPSPAPDHETEFHQKLRQALVRAELEKLIRPLPARRDPAA